MIFKPKMLFFLIFVALNTALCAQDIDQMITDKALNREILIDFVSRDGLQSGEFAEYYSQEYDNYIADFDVAQQLKDKIEGLDIVIVLGSWCHDSKIQVPRFLKLLDIINFPEDQLVIMGVDSQKMARTLDIEIYEIERVPTFIFYRNGKSIGRIVENPTNSLEADMLKIVH